MNFEELYQKIEEIRKQKKCVIIGIDGRCASGKTTLAQDLHEKYHASVIHMDDFFLRPEQRTPHRYQQPGGNVDYERFCEEVKEPMKQYASFSYRPFDCQKMQLSDPVAVESGDVMVVEGSYSMLPQLRDLYDLKVFLTVDSVEQMKRIQKRNPDKVDAFREKWIPYEELYFDTYKVSDVCDMIFDTTTMLEKG